MNVLATARRNKLPLVVISVVFLVIGVLLLTTPEPEKRGASSVPRISVDVLEIQAMTINPSVLSYGLVEPRVKSNLVAQVSGHIQQVDERFRDGGFFREGELLLQIDTTDYEIELDIAQASLAEAEQRLAVEIARVEQARVDWERLGDDEAPKPLVLRQPQLRAAQANVGSAKALLRKARVNLDRTTIRAPYDGRVLSTSVDLGQVVSEDTVLGEIYATDAVEVRLPIKNDDLPLIKLPEDYRYQASAAESLPPVRIRSELGKEEIWHGTIVRTAGSIEDESRQLYVVARIEDPFGEKAEGRFPLKIGQYVTAEIDGLPLNDAVTIPNRSIYQGSYVYLHRESAVYRTPIEISWQNGEIAIVSSGIRAGDQLVISPLGQVVSGTLVEVSNTVSGAASTEGLSAHEVQAVGGAL